MGYEFRKQNCIICRDDDARFLGLREPRAFRLPAELLTRIVQCRRCGLIYPDPMPVADEQQRAANYGDPSAYFPHPLSEERFAAYSAIMESMERLGGVSGGRLLDVGCGRGELLMAAERRGWEGVGIEPSPAFARQARQNCKADVHCGRLEGARLPERSFDAAALVSVLQHAQDPCALLAAAFKALRPGGLLFLETMNHASPVYRVPDACYRILGRNVTTHLSPTFPSYELFGFSAGPLGRLLRSSGFRVIRMETLGGICKTTSRPSGLTQRVLQAGLKAVMLCAKAVGNGQVLFTYARRPP